MPDWGNKNSPGICMRHGLDSCLPVLRRWGAMSERPLPSDWAGFRRDNPTEAMAIEARDPELISLLNNTCSATLKADALGGKFSPIAPDPEVMAEQGRKAEIQRLLDSNPWGTKGAYDSNGVFQEGTAPDLTSQLLLSQLDPALYAKQQAKFNPQPTAEEQAVMQQERAEREAAARLQSVQHASRGHF